MVDKKSGILLHITSLPGNYGVGDIGVNAYKFIDFLKMTGFKYWQFLPVLIPGKGNSPYQGFSAFAGNPTLVSPDLLYEDGYIHKDDFLNVNFPKDKVDYLKANNFKKKILNLAFFKIKDSIQYSTEFQEFCYNNMFWLDDFAMFAALKQKFNNQKWTNWPVLIKNRHIAELESIEKNLKQNIVKQKFFQYIFYNQWKKLKIYAFYKSIKLIGDLPLYISHDSADVWRNPELFKLNINGYSDFIAGVPPDYFSKKGQLWNNPVYDWKAHYKSNFSWWRERVNKNLDLVDILRLDHFRGFSRYWEVPANENSAKNGKWVEGPGFDLFKSIKPSKKSSGSTPFLAEDLGVIDDEVIKLRDSLEIPGMVIIQFAFNKEDFNIFDQIPVNCYLYTGTHDNDTLNGFLKKTNKIERNNLKRIMNKSIENISSWDIILMCWSSNASNVIAPIQDLLDLDSGSRMNTPGKQRGNWTWRLNCDISELVKVSDKFHKLNQNNKRN